MYKSHIYIYRERERDPSYGDAAIHSPTVISENAVNV